MQPPDDYRNEMDRLSSHEADRVLSGDPPASGPGRTAAALVETLRADLLIVQDPDVARRHLATMRAAAAASARDRVGIPMRPRARKRLASLALAAALILGAGIAGALTLPDRAPEVAKDRVFDVEPNGPKPGKVDEGSSSDDASSHGKVVSTIARDDSTRGCEHGRAVSEAASAKSADNRANEGGHRAACEPNQENKGNHGAGDKGKHGAGNKGNHGAENNGKGEPRKGKPAVASSKGESKAGVNAKSAAPHGKETAPGQSKHEISEVGEVPDLFPPGA